MVLLINSNDVMANECVECSSASTDNYVCGVDEKGNAKKFQSECALRFENCDKKTSKE